MAQAAQQLSDTVQAPTHAGAAAAVFALHCLHELQAAPQGGAAAGGGPPVRAYLPLPALRAAVKLLAELRRDGPPTAERGRKIDRMQQHDVLLMWSSGPKHYECTAGRAASPCGDDGVTTPPAPLPAVDVAAALAAMHRSGAFVVGALCRPASGSAAHERAARARPRAAAADVTAEQALNREAKFFLNSTLEVGCAVCCVRIAG